MMITRPEIFPASTCPWLSILGLSFRAKSIVKSVAAEFSVEASAAVSAARKPVTTSPVRPAGKISKTIRG